MAHSHESYMTKKHETTTKVDVSTELEAIRQRVAARRRRGFAGIQEPYTPTDLADAEFLIFELDAAMGHRPLLTPAEQDELHALQRKRELTEPQDVAVLAKLSAKHGELTPEELVMNQYLSDKADAQLTAQELERYRELMGQAKKRGK